MRIPQARQGPPVNTPRGVGATTQPPPQGQAPHGGRRKPGVNGRPTILGQEVYLWILVVIEASLTGALRRAFRRFHGG